MTGPLLHHKAKPTGFAFFYGLFSAPALQKPALLTGCLTIYNMMPFTFQQESFKFEVSG